MKGKAASGVRMVLEFLIIQLQGEQSERSSMLEGTIVISLDIQDAAQRVNQSHCVAIIAAKGDLCHKLLNDLTFREIESVLSFCQSGVLHGTLDLVAMPLEGWVKRQLKSLMTEGGHNKTSVKGFEKDTLIFSVSLWAFQLYEKSDVLKEDSITLKQFVHRISLVHTTITFHYCVKVNGNISAETYRSKFRAVVPSCDKIHLVTDELVETGFTGALSLIPAASLCPCQKSFPNQPAKIIAASPTIYIFLYDPAGLPILFSAEEVSYSFFEDPSRLASWGKYAYQATLNSAACCKTDTVRPEIQFNLQTSHQQDSEIQDQTLLLFLFLGYTDPFQDKPKFTFWNRRMILSHLSPILFCSEQAVKRATQELVNDVLHQHYRLFQEQQKLACSLPIMASAISRIFDGISATKKRKPANRRIPTEEDSEDLNFSGEAKNQEPKGSLPTRPEATSASAFSSSSKSERHIFPDKSQGDDGITGAARSKNLCQ
ncbi:hypothetical protein E2320_013809, partial [Naja naja]